LRYPKNNFSALSCREIGQQKKKAHFFSDDIIGE
jgi:hypothetical protein